MRRAVMAKRSPEQILDAIDAWDQDDAIDAEMERVLALAPEERERELLAAGVDVEAERAKAREWREKAAGGDRPAAPEELQPEKIALAASPNAAQPPIAALPRGRARLSRGWWASRGGMVAAAALAAAGLLVLARHEPPVGSGHHDDGQQHELTSRDRAEALRQKAYAACDKRAWAECRALLDDAKGLDPAGEADSRVKKSRDAIREAQAP
jgi:hypothetical protein